MKLMLKIFAFRHSGMKGTTLTELMISTAIFGFITLGLLGMVQYGTKAWRKVDSRFEVEKNLRRAVLDINYNLRNTDITTFNCGLINNGASSWMAFKIPVKYVKTEEEASLLGRGLYEILPSQIDYDPTSTAPAPVNWNFFILYMTMPPQSCPECARLGITGTAVCPHKQLVKRWIYCHDDKMPVGMKAFARPDGLAEDTQGREYLTSDLFSKITDFDIFEPVFHKGDRIIAKDIINFNINFYDDYKDAARPPEVLTVPDDRRAQRGTVQYTIRAFKAFEASSTHVKSDSFQQKAFSDRFTIQIDQGVTPMNSRTGR